MTQTTDAGTRGGAAQTAKKDESAPRGLEAVVAAETTLGAVDGTAGTLHYIGYNIDDLVTNARFEDVLYLLLHGELPSADESAALSAALAAAQGDQAALDLLQSLPPGGAPIDALRTAISALGQLDPTVEDESIENTRRIGVRLAGLMAVAFAWNERRTQGQAPLAPRPELGHAANILFMLHGVEPSETAARALNAYLILLAEHGLNASTFTARVATGTGSDAYAAITAAMATLKGDAHGGANRRAMEMLNEIGSPENVDDWVGALIGTKRRLMGFGHRIYKTRDPRAKHLQGFARALSSETGRSVAYATAMRVDQVASENPYFSERKLYPNVEFYTAPLLDALGFRPELMPAAFALSRVAGWTGHILEQRADNRLIRPAAHYIGPEPRPFPGAR